MEYHSFLCKKICFKWYVYEFPSPYGVLFILIFMAKKLTAGNLLGAFPSPYGVSLILIDKILLDIETNTLPCFRLLTEYHSFLSREALI